MEERALARDITTVTTEIRTLMRQAQQMALVYAIEIGRRLTEAKSLLPHGEWGRWLKEEVDFSQSSANNFMRIFDEYGADQISLFGAEANSQTLGNLPYTKALKLLAIPADEREEFVEKHDVENLSSRELEKVIRERDESLAREKAMAEEREKIAAELKEQKRKKEEANHAFVEADHKRRALERDIEGLKKELASATKEKVIEVQPTEAKLSEAEIKAIKKEAAEKAKAKAEKLIAEKEQELAKAKADAEFAQAAADRERSRAEQLEKELRAADPAVAQFKGFFTAFQEAYLNCKAQVEIIGKEKPEVAEKLRAAMMAVMQ